MLLRFLLWFAVVDISYWFCYILECYVNFELIKFKFFKILGSWKNLPDDIRVTLNYKVCEGYPFKFKDYFLTYAEYHRLIHKLHKHKKEWK